MIYDYVYIYIFLVVMYYPFLAAANTFQISLTQICLLVGRPWRGHHNDIIYIDFKICSILSTYKKEVLYHLVD